MSESAEMVSTEATEEVAARASGAGARQGLWRAHVELGKVRINALVVFTTALGFVVGSKLNHFPITGRYPDGLDWGRLLWTCVGTFLAAVGAAAFNQAVEAPRDARMRRTMERPLCRGRLSRTYAAALGLIVGLGGVVLLGVMTNGLTAGLAAGNLILYIAVYTPLKPVSTINTLVGAVVGGLPPVVGWTAATGELSAGALVLGGILFTWQVPHFLAFCWMYREDYGRGGFKMLPIADTTGQFTSQLALLYAVLLAPLCLLETYLGHAGWVFAGVSLALTTGLILAALRFVRRRGDAEARRLFFASIVYLPVLCVVLMADARGPLSAWERTPTGWFEPASTGERFIDPSGAEAQRFNAALVPGTRARTSAEGDGRKR
jgi:heme o synthase